MIVTPEGLNVFPEDVERVLNAHARRARLGGRRRAATGGEERVHAVLVLEPGVDPDAVVRAAPTRSSTIIRRSGARSVWPEPELPRTEGTRKLKRAAIRDWVRERRRAAPAQAGGDALAALVASYAPARSDVTPTTTLEELGLSSLERVELMVALEDAFQTRIDEGAFADARERRRAARRSSSERRASGAQRRPSRSTFPRGTARGRRAPSAASACRPGSCRSARVFAWIARRGTRAPATRIDGPVDLRRQPSEPHGRPGDPGGAAAAAGATASRRRWRRSSSRRTSSRSSTAARQWFTNSLNYYLAALFFNAFPLPQREAGARQTLRYIGELLEERLLGADLSRRASGRETARSTASGRASG